MHISFTPTNGFNLRDPPEKIQLVYFHISSDLKQQRQKNTYNQPHTSVNSEPESRY